ncbi:hypothetical protein [Tranquillimonas rosea]|uniref:hypothetical protein n=1 Tax=Tranquillimonas rosea TaxID=641238 RepID=UPI003BAB5826
MIARDAQWGPWIRHDGKGLPPELIGKSVHAVAEMADGRMTEEVGTPMEDDELNRCWDWSYFRCYSETFNWHWSRVTRYRVRKPDALVQLERLAASPLVTEAA